MKKTIIISTILYCCKPYDQATKSLARAEDEVKIAINYLGENNCTDTAIRTKNTNMSSHKLDGPNGELAVEEFKEAMDKDEVVLSGDKFLATNKIERSIDAIEANCRRLILSIEADSQPTIKVTKGEIPENQLDRFNKDFSEFKPFTCQDKFCTSNEIKRGKRYFAYIKPSKENNFKAQLSYTYDSKAKNDIPITLTEVKPRTVTGTIIALCFKPLDILQATYDQTEKTVSASYQKNNCKQQLVINTNTRNYLQDNNVRCLKGEKGVVILIGNGERVASDCTNDKVISLAISNSNLQINSFSRLKDTSPNTTLTFNQSGNFDAN